MLLTRSPVRISFGGGGTDLPSFYERHGGAVVSTTIDRYVYVLLHVTQSSGLQITSSDYRTFYRHSVDEPLKWDGDLSLPKAVLHHFGVTRGLRMFVASEVPPGTGLGSSSAVAVALIKAVSTACGQELSRHQIADLACQTEMEKMQMPIGKQDQYAAAFGGLNLFTFSREGVQIEPVKVDPSLVERFQERLLLFYTGASRDSSTILGEQKRRSQEDDATVVAALKAVKAIGYEVKRLLERGRLSELGELLDASWEQKKRFASGVSKPFVDESYALARKMGALGGKLTGAGGGGFLMLYCEPRFQTNVTDALERRGLKRMDFHFEQSGVRVLTNNGVQLTRTLAAGF